MNDRLKLKNYERPKLEMPNGEKNLLLHSCCAPCSGEIIEGLAASDIKTTVFFYNPNIHPIDEYEICLLYTSPSPRDVGISRMPSSA